MYYYKEGVNMKEIVEEVNCLGNLYKIYIDSNFIRKVNIVRISKTYEGYHYVFLFDSNGEVIKEVFDYLNFHCANEGISGREQAASALKLLFSFSEIVGREINEFDKTDIINLSDFVLGHSIQGNVERYILKTSRTITTHNTYFDEIRKFISITGIENKAFFEKKQVLSENIIYGVTSDNPIITDKYTTNKSRHKSFSEYVPKYISLAEYCKITQSFSLTKNPELKLRNTLIVDLMYTRGLRIGEVLGITLEDIISHPDDKKAGLLYLRNRVSDKKYQHAKTCMKVSSTQTYRTKAYKSERDKAYETIALPSKLMDQIREYQNISRDIFTMTEKKLNNIMKFSKADCVGEATKENYYLFLNKNGSPLSSSGWNVILKRTFNEFGIYIDKGNKEE